MLPASLAMAVSATACRYVHTSVDNISSLFGLEGALGPLLTTLPLRSYAC